MKMPEPNMKKITFAGETIPRKAMADPDKDGYPNVVDCSNLNRNKQGAVSWIIAKAKGKTHDEVEAERKLSRSGYNVEAYSDNDADDMPAPTEKKQPERKKGFLETAGERYKQYKAEAPQRQKAQIERLKSDLEIQKLKGDIASSRTAMQRQRLSLMAEKQKSMGAMPSMMGGFGSIGGAKPTKMPSLMNPFAEPVVAKKKKAKKMKRHRKKSKGKKVIMYMR